MKKIIKRLIVFKKQTLLAGLFSLLMLQASAQCSLQNLSYEPLTVIENKITICYQFDVNEKTSDRYEVLFNNSKVKTATYATLSANTCFTIAKEKFMLQNVLEIQDQNDRSCKTAINASEKKLKLTIDNDSKEKHFELLKEEAKDGVSVDYKFLDKKENGIPMGVLLPNKKILANTTVELPIILGSEKIPVEGLYGIAFSLQLDANIMSIPNVEVDFENSWLASDGDPLLSHTNFNSESGRLDVGLTKTNGHSIYGQGSIATLRIIILIEIEPEKRDANFFSIDIENILISGRSKGLEQLSDMGISLQSSNAQVIAGFNNHLQLPQNVNLYPTLANQHLYIENNDHKKIECIIFDLIGNTIYKNSIDNHLTTISTNEWATGLYYVNFIMDNQTYSKRVLVRH